MMGTKIMPMPWERRMPIRGGSNPMMVPTMSTPMPMKPVESQTSATTKRMTPITICCRGMAACRRNMPLPTYRIIGIANKPAAKVTASSRIKSDVGSREDHVSMGYIIFRAKVAPDLDRLMMYRKPRTITVTAVLTAERMAMISKSCC